MTTVNWDEILSKKTDEISRPETVPVGTYIGVITEFKLDTSKNKGTPYCRYSIRPISPQGDVDQDALTKFGGIEKLASKLLNLDYYLTPDAQYRLKEFLERLGVGISGRSLQAVIPDAVNKQVRIHVTHALNRERPTDPPFANIDDIAAA